MAGSRLPAINGPAGANTERTVVDGSVVVVELVRRCEDGDLRHEEHPGLRGRAAGDAQSGLVRYLGRVFGNQGTVGLRFDRGSCADRGDKRPFRATGQDRARTGSAGRGWWGTSVGDVVRNFSHPTEACRSVGAERNRGYKNPGHPLRPCFVLADGVGTVPTLALVAGRGSVFESSGTVCCAFFWRLPIWSAGGQLRIEAFRWVSCGLPDRSPVLVSRGDAVTVAGGGSPISAGGSLKPTLAAVPRCLEWRGHHECPRGGREIGGNSRGGRGAWQSPSGGWLPGRAAGSRDPGVAQRPFEPAFQAVVVVARAVAEERGLDPDDELPSSGAGVPQARDRPWGVVEVAADRGEPLAVRRRVLRPVARAFTASSRLRRTAPSWWRMSAVLVAFAADPAVAVAQHLGVVERDLADGSAAVAVVRAVALRGIFPGHQFSATSAASSPRGRHACAAATRAPMRTVA